MYTKEGIRKPVWRAFQLLHKAGDEKLNVSVAAVGGKETAVTAFATTVAGGSGVGLRGLQIFASNFWPSAAASANPRTPVATELEVQLVLPVGEAVEMPTSCFLWRIDDNATAPAAAWRDMGSPTWNTKAIPTTP